jgi:two-component system sensor histidine kinase/response regulator
MESRQGETVIIGEEILIIEDSLTQAEQLRDILERHDYRVSAAANGREALAAMAARKPSLIISDIIMPEMDGYELCSRIKADERYREIPVILLTSLSNPQDVIRGLECGADNFITKPYNEEYLLSRIRHMEMDRSRPEGAEPAGGLTLHHGGQEYVITAGRRQIVNLLLSTYETALQQNRELTKARDELHDLNEQLETANKELEAFSYTVSHDLRSPLTCINGYCQLLADLCGESLDDQSKEFVQEIQEATDRMGQLITTLLNFSQLTRKEITRETVNLSKLAQTISLDLRLREPGRKVTFNIAEGGVVNGDAKLLRVVLDNLVGNAWKYSGKRADAVIEFGMLDQGREKVYFVRDNGVGFDMAYADRLFAAFERLHDSEEFEGIGIGLVTVQRIIQRHGGRIWAEGEEGKGATFYFTLGEE